MMNKLGAWAVAVGVWLLFGLLAWLLPGWAGLAGAPRVILAAGLVVLGTAAAVLLFLVLARRARGRVRTDEDAADEMQPVLRSAEARLGRSGAGEARMDRLPVVLFMGPTGSAKTSVISHSGLEAELLAGEVSRADTVVPTDPLNVWYAEGAMLLEPGGRVLEDAARWRRFVPHLRASRLGAAIGQGRQPSRVAVVCLACDEFLKPGASEAIPALARKLRSRIDEVATQLGIQLPVYVLFTRADRLPYFTDYVRSLDASEAQQVLGATLPLHTDEGGAWTERESRRLNTAYDRMVRALSVRRVDVLSRESQEEVRAGAYEFPRELGKLRELAVQFLLDVCRPTQLGLSPVLRGYYFTGVRPVVLRDVAATPQPQAQPRAVDAGATSVFDPRALQQAVSPSAPPGTRRVPEWVFLRRLFRDVVLADGVAHGLTAGGTRVNLLRRTMLGIAAAACLILVVGFTVSFAANRGFVRDASEAVTTAAAVGATPGMVTEADLVALDTLRSRTERVGIWTRSGAPLRMKWGLFVGDRVQPILRQRYFERFGDALWRDTRASLLGYLGALPDRPDENSDFGAAQAALAAHLMTTSEFRRSTPELLTPVLTSHWPGATADSSRALAERQFAYFASELPHGNPFDEAPDDALVTGTRDFLRAFGSEAYYRALIYAAANEARPVSWIGAQSVVRNEDVIPPAFTLEGWHYVQANLDSVNTLFSRYEWMYGSQPPADPPSRAQLEQRYVDDYIRRWQTYLDRAAVQPFSSVTDAAFKLSNLATNNSPLFGMLAVASRQTAMDTTTAIGRAFQPLHATVAPGADPQGLTASVLPYTGALNTLASQLTQIAAVSGATRSQLLPTASAATADVRLAAQGIAATYRMDGAAAVTAASLQRLLNQPANLAADELRSLPAEELNAAGADFCRAAGSIASRFPFNGGASSEADVQDVFGIFQQGDGLLWSFHQGALQSLLNRQGRSLPGSNVRADFARYFARAAEFSNGVFRDGSMRVAFDFQPTEFAGASGVTLELDGRRENFSPTRYASRLFQWDAEQASTVRLEAQFDGEVVTIGSFSGPWAIFRLFHAGRWSGSGPYSVSWPVPGRGGVLTAQVTLEPGVPPVFRPDYLAGLSQCVSRIIN